VPQSGVMAQWRMPPDLRVEHALQPGSEIPPFYDSMIGKLIARGRDRSEAIERILKAIRDFRVEGLKTTLPLLSFVAAHKDFRENRITTRWLEDKGLPDFARA